MAKIKPGDTVRVNFEPGDQFTGDPARRFNGQELKVVSKRDVTYGVYGHIKGTEYYLEGAESSYGLPYAFVAERLERMK